jgi:uncharacterized membrane protein YdfJ with MMPL/SSD domain
LLDATLIRAVLLPSVMTLLGDRNWNLPRWLSGSPGPPMTSPVSGHPNANSH